MTTALERLATLETEMKAVREAVTEIRTMVREVRDTQLTDKAAVKGGWTVLQFAYPPVSAAVVWLLVHMTQAGLQIPLPRP